jgi:hypothetical protein
MDASSRMGYNPHRGRSDGLRLDKGRGVTGRALDDGRSDGLRLD